MQWHTCPASGTRLNESVAVIVGDIGNHEGSTTYLLYYCFLGVLSGQIPPLHAGHIGNALNHGYQGIALHRIPEQGCSKK